MKVQNLDLGLKVLILLEGPHGSMKDHIGTIVMFYIRSEFLAFKYLVIVFFRNKKDDFSYLYIRNLENSRLNSVFLYAIFICICVGR